MSATTEKYHVNVIYARVYVADQDLPFAVAAVLGRNDNEESVRARFIKRFPNLVGLTPVNPPDDENDYDDTMEEFMNNVIFI